MKPTKKNKPATPSAKGKGKEEESSEEDSDDSEEDSEEEEVMMDNSKYQSGIECALGI